MAGVDLRTVHELLGHKDPTMTARYAHLSPAHQAAAVAKLTAALTPTPEAARVVAGVRSDPPAPVNLTRFEHAPSEATRPRGWQLGTPDRNLADRHNVRPL
jgi:hypothetical protein